jgi:hypothetical protein
MARRIERHLSAAPSAVLDWGSRAALVEQLLHHRQQTGHRRPRHTGSGFESDSRALNVSLTAFKASKYPGGAFVYREQRLNVVERRLSARIENAEVVGPRRQRKVIARDDDLIGAYRE